MFGVRGSLLLPRSVLRAILDEAWQAWPEETGGVLLGSATVTDARVQVAVGPGPKAVHRSHSFEPDADWQAREVARLWELDGRLQYLGDWHTHPKGSPSLSALDRDAMRAIAAYPDARQRRPVMLVLGLAADGGVRGRAERLVCGRLESLRMEVVS